MIKPIKRISINTGGGDAPGLNAVIYAAVHAASRLGWQVLGIREGYDGLLFPDQYPDGGLVELDMEKVKNIPHLGGTMLNLQDRPGSDPATPGLSPQTAEVSARLSLSPTPDLRVHAHPFPDLAAI